MKKRYFLELNSKLLNKFKNKFISLRELIYVLIDSRFLIRKTDKVLFLDLGSNIGQGYKWFSKFFQGSNILAIPGIDYSFS